jgi:polysaccharide biosynthesis protein PslG
MFRKLAPLLAVLFILLGLWPEKVTLYDLTGEEDLPAQVRGAVHWLYSAVRPQPRLDQQAAVTPTVANPFGMNTFLQGEVLPEVREESLRLLHEAGFGFIRQQFPWEDIEIHAKGDFIDRRNDPQGVDAWAKYDNIVALAERYEIEIIARLDNPPAWTRALTDTIGTHAPPDDYDDYGDFVEAVVSRYRGRVHYFQLWNEPNIYPEWGEQPVDPEAFSELLCTGYRRAKEADPEAVILAGALSPTIALDGRDLNDLVFLQRMYLAGAGSCFDILSAQGYGLWSGPTDRRLRPTVINYPHVLFLRDVMVTYGAAEKPIWISEAGWNSVPEGMPDPYGRVDAEQQGRYAVQAYQRAASDWPWVGVINYWFLKRPSDLERDQPWYYFRLMEPDFTPAPAWLTLTAYTSQQPDAAAVSTTTLGDAWRPFRPWAALGGGFVLFFWLLGFLAPATSGRDGA